MNSRITYQHRKELRKIMKLVPYEEFGRLRLRPSCPGDKTYKEEILETHQEEVLEKNRGHFIMEIICRGISFWRWSGRPDELATICIHSANFIWPKDIATPILAALGLGLDGGLTNEETASRFAVPPHWRSQNGKFAIFRTSGDSTYDVNCGFEDHGKLDRIMVHRLDLKIEHLL